MSNTILILIINIVLLTEREREGLSRYENVIIAITIVESCSQKCTFTYMFFRDPKSILWELRTCIGQFYQKSVAIRKKKMHF